MKHCKRILALLLAVTMCVTGLPLNALAVYYAPGTVIDEDEEGSEPSVIYDEDNGTLYYAGGTVIDEDSLTADEWTETNTEYNGVPDNFEKEYADEIFTNEYGEEIGMFTIGEDTSSNGVMAVGNSTTRKIHFYVDYQNTLNDGANGANFTILGGAQWVNSYPKTAVLLDANGNETNQWFAGYCLNYGLDLPDKNQTETSYLTDAQKTIIGDILSMGYQHSGGKSIDDNSRYKWLITQIYIWAVCQGTLQYNTKTGVNELTGRYGVKTVDETFML